MKNEIFNWQMEGDTAGGSFNAVYIAGLSLDDFKKSSIASQFAHHSPEAANIRMEALYKAAQDKVGVKTEAKAKQGPTASGGGPVQEAK